jgi:hypothetical protein
MPEDISEADFGAALADAVEGSFVVTEKLDLETGTSLAVTVEGDFVLDIAPFAEMAGEQEQGTVRFSFTMNYALSNVNNVDTITLPEDAQVIPVETVLGGI